MNSHNRFCRASSLCTPMRICTIVYSAVAAVPVLDRLLSNRPYDQESRLTEVSVFPSNVSHQMSVLVQRYKERSGCPGVSVCVSYGGRLLYTGVFGFANVENMVPVQENTVFRIASISKTFTSVLVGRLMEQSKLDLDENIRTYLPEFPEKTVNGACVKITARSLLSHTSGIRSYTKSDKGDGQSCYPEMLLQQRYDNSLDACNLFKDQPLLHAPGERYTYSTFGFTLLSAVIESICARRGPCFMDYSFDFQTSRDANAETSTLPAVKINLQFSRLFTFLGLRNTYLDYHEQITPTRASCYRRNSKNVLENTPMVDNSYKWAGGGILSTSYDLIVFANHIANIYLDRLPLTGVIKPETLRCLWTVSAINPKSDWQPGLGWFLARRSGEVLSQKPICPDRLYVGHTGGAVGGTSVLLLSLPCCSLSNHEGCPKINCDIRDGTSKLAPICVAILTNLEDASGIKELAVSLAELVVDALIR